MRIKNMISLKTKPLFSLCCLLLFAGCKDDNVKPPDNSNNEYTISGKIIDGTTMKPKYPGMVMSLKISYTDFIDSESEVLGQCKMNNQGEFEITYKHSKLAEKNSAKLILLSSFYSSPPLPKNQNWVTTIYESTSGKVEITLNNDRPSTGDTLFIGYYDNDMDIDRKIYVDTIVSDFKGVYKTFTSPNPRKVFWWGKGQEEFEAYLPDNSKIVTISGDPIIDTLTINF
jgi:hypothetical protein